MIDRTRLGRIIENMQGLGLSQLIATSPQAVFYLTGEWVEPMERMMAVYVNDAGDVTFITHPLFALSDTSGMSIISHTDNDDPIDLLAGIVKPGELGIDKLWPSQFLIRLMDKRPDVKPRLGSAAVDRARMYKDARELELLRVSSAINDATISAGLDSIGEGMSELDIARRIAAQYDEEGADAGASETSVSFGANCAEPHHEPDDTVLRAGDSVLIDTGKQYGRYFSDMTRTVFFGRADDEQRRVYELVMRANAAGRAAVRPGVRLADVDRAARAVIEAAGYGKFFYHRLGHGLGIQIHEPPDVSAASEAIAQPSMVFTIEPGIYLEGRFGVRIEDVVCVTEDGVEVLNAYPRELNIIG